VTRAWALAIEANAKISAMHITEIDFVFMRLLLVGLAALYNKFMTVA
jgi:hypothetical protein